ncbi:pepsin A-like [Zootermopsis nevadensis]|uniref:Cathepsin E-A n=1 Tax=Zootermopsis nevadensis TaxID=136037 RepID=A0A067QGB5_ZOONE|nr:pepsin A-like [Zootermopsis nevadensis]KDR06735.1 Cathepsin E-A [Zootermopsis nevadensis]
MCKSTPYYCKYHDVFRANLSDTYHLEKQYGNISLSYAEIKVYGPVAKDTLTVGGIRIPDFAFVPANGFYQAPVDGILGLSFQEGSQGPSRATPNNNLIREPTFSLYIKK